MGVQINFKKDADGSLGQLEGEQRSKDDNAKNDIETSKLQLCFCGIDVHQYLVRLLMSSRGIFLQKQFFGKHTCPSSII